MSEELQDERSKAVELLRLHDELDALDQPLPPKEVGRLGLLLLLVVVLFAGALMILAYTTSRTMVMDVMYGSIAILLAGQLVYGRMEAARLLAAREPIQSQIREIEDVSE